MNWEHEEEEEDKKKTATLSVNSEHISVPSFRHMIHWVFRSRSSITGCNFVIFVR